MRRLALALGSLAIIALVLESTLLSNTSVHPCPAAPPLSAVAAAPVPATSPGRELDRTALCAADPRAWWSAPRAGVQLCYQFAIESHTELRRGEQHDTMLHRAAGQLRWSCRSRRRDAVVLELELTPVAIGWQLDDEPVDAGEPNAVRHAWLQLGGDGQLAVSFDAGTSAHHRLLLRELIAMFMQARVNPLPADSRAWSQTTAAPSNGGADAAASLAVTTTSEARIPFSSLVEPAPAAPGLDPDPCSFSDLQGGEEFEILLPHLERLEFRALLSGVSLEQLLAQLDHATPADERADRQLAQRKLTWHLRFHPEDLERLRALLIGTDLGRTASRTILPAVAAVEGASARRLLLELLDDDRLDDTVASAALAAMIDCTPPADELAAAVERALRSRSSRPVQREALLALGAMAARPGPQQAAASLRLLDLESVAESDLLLGAWLDAVGAGAPEQAVVAAGRHLGAADERTRAAAVAALREAPADAAVAMLAPLVQSDPARLVRARAAEIVAQHATPEAMRTTAEVLANDADADVRIAVVAALGRRPDRTDDVTVQLRLAATADPADQVRELADELLRAPGQSRELPPPGEAR
ncbi:MAG: HEAT repeat domain-containing protein [Planctomycetota bacterium]